MTKQYFENFVENFTVEEILTNVVQVGRMDLSNLAIKGEQTSEYDLESEIVESGYESCEATYKVWYGSELVAEYTDFDEMINDIANGKFENK